MENKKPKKLASCIHLALSISSSPSENSQKARYQRRSIISAALVVTMRANYRHLTLISKILATIPLLIKHAVVGQRQGEEARNRASGNPDTHRWD